MTLAFPPKEADANAGPPPLARQAVVGEPAGLEEEGEGPGLTMSPPVFLFLALPLLPPFPPLPRPLMAFAPPPFWAPTTATSTSRQRATARPPWAQVMEGTPGHPHLGAPCCRGLQAGIGRAACLPQYWLNYPG